MADTGDEPWYVLEKDLTHNQLIVGQGNENPRLYSNRLIASEIHWIDGSGPQLPFRCKAKTRYRQPDQDCLIEPIEKNHYQVSFSQPQRAVTPGQYVVLYDGEVCLGGGVIEQTARDLSSQPATLGVEGANH